MSKEKPIVRALVMQQLLGRERAGINITRQPAEVSTQAVVLFVVVFLIRRTHIFSSS